MSIGSRSYSRATPSSSPETPSDDEIMWNASSPTGSDDSDNSNDSRASSSPPRAVSSSSAGGMHTAPGSPPNKLASVSKPSHPYRPTAPPSRPVRPRGLGLTPLSHNTENGLPLGTGQLPKAQPLSRALFARKLSDTPHAGTGAKKKGAAKLIVPTKGFKTTFELDLTSNELARK